MLCLCPRVGVEGAFSGASGNWFPSRHLMITPLFAGGSGVGTFG